MGIHTPLSVQDDVYNQNNWSGKSVFGLGKTSKHNFTFVFVKECERVPLKKKTQKAFMCNGVW